MGDSRKIKLASPQATQRSIYFGKVRDVFTSKRDLFKDALLIERKRKSPLPRSSGYDTAQHSAESNSDRQDTATLVNHLHHPWIPS